MAKPSFRRSRDVEGPTPFEHARDEMFQHIMQCGVIGADAEHRAEWFDTTLEYLADRFHELSPEQITELRTLGERFCQPPKAAIAQPAGAASAA